MCHWEERLVNSRLDEGPLAARLCDPEFLTALLADLDGLQTLLTQHPDLVEHTSAVGIFQAVDEEINRLKDNDYLFPDKSYRRTFFSEALRKMTAIENIVGQRIAYLDCER